MARRPPWFSALLVASAALAGPGLAVELGQLADPRPNGWVVDQAGALSAATEAELGRLGDRVKAETGAELAVVVVDTTGGVDAHRFALDLANRWGLASSERDDGLLVFAALDDRAAEILLGDGIDSDASVRSSEAIMQGVMVPKFRAGDPEAAMLEGATACAERILGLGALEDRQSLLETPARQPARARSEGSSGRKTDPVTGGLLAALAAGLLGGGVWLVRKLTPGNERCPRCRQPMVELDEAADDAHLTPGELAEERVGSANWRVWACSSCTEVVKRQRGRWFSRYSRCPQCGAKTKNETKTTLAAATYSQAGRVRIEERCAACSYSQTYARSTPVLTRSSSSSTGGRSVGGGSFSGRGASGRW